MPKLEPFESADKEKLASVLHAPQREFYNTKRYPTLESQAAVLFYEMIQMHPFINGNKRMACICLFAFLKHNGYWLKITDQELSALARETAVTEVECREAVIERLTQKILYKMQENTELPLAA